MRQSFKACSSSVITAAASALEATAADSATLKSRLAVLETAVDDAVVLGTPDVNAIASGLAVAVQQTTQFASFEGGSGDLIAVIAADQLAILATVTDQNPDAMSESTNLAGAESLAMLLDLLIFNSTAIGSPFSTSGDEHTFAASRLAVTVADNLGAALWEWPTAAATTLIATSSLEPVEATLGIGAVKPDQAVVGLVPGDLARAGASLASDIILVKSTSATVSADAALNFELDLGPRIRMVLSKAGSLSQVSAVALSNSNGTLTVEITSASGITRVPALLKCAKYEPSRDAWVHQVDCEYDGSSRCSCNVSRADGTFAATLEVTFDLEPLTDITLAAGSVCVGAAALLVFVFLVKLRDYVEARHIILINVGFLFGL